MALYGSEIKSSLKITILAVTAGEPIKGLSNEFTLSAESSSFSVFPVK